MTSSSPSANPTNAADLRGHESGAGCPACPTYEDWADSHCYSCGGVFSAAVAGLNRRMRDADSREEYDALCAELTTLPEHADHCPCAEAM